MQKWVDKNFVSLMQGSTSNLMQEGIVNGSVNLSSQSAYVSLESEERPLTDNAPDNLNTSKHANLQEKNVGAGDNEDEVTLKRKRSLTSSVWIDFEKVTLKNGGEKVECKHCHKRLTVSKSGTTTSFKRHLNGCLKHKEYQRTQQLLNFQPLTPDVDMGSNKSHLLIRPDAKYDVNKMREAVALWIMGTEQPFLTVEDDLFVYMMKTANPLYDKVTRVTTKSDCFKVYEYEKKKLKDLTDAASSISLTTDCWRSSHQKIEYMVITGHFIDHNWRLQKRVLSFVHVPPPRTGRDIADGIYKCLKEWEIDDKVFSISVDNASYNDKVVDTLKTSISRVRKLVCDGNLFHVRCCAHILNLLVKDGLSEIALVIGEVREAVKYINYSEARRKSFSEVVDKQKVKDRRLLLDVPTRWNSTYEMLSHALKFKDVFPEYAIYEPHFKHVPSKQDWENVEKVCKILKVFKMCTNIISGSHYPTANLYLIEVYKVKETLDKGSESEDDFIRNMVKKMKEKFDKYWGECHLLMAIASVLDPRFKKWLIGQAYPVLYTSVEAANNIELVEKALEGMYKEYLEVHDALVREAATRESGSSIGNTTTKSNENTSHGSGWDAYMQFVKNVDLEKPPESELKMYYDEGIYKVQGGMETFSALDWWNVHKFKYPVLSKMAIDVLAVPISTVASEATFSAGGRVIDPYRSKLDPNTVEMLICGGD